MYLTILSACQTKNLEPIRAESQEDSSIFYDRLMKSKNIKPMMIVTVPTEI
jgi:hypothetical protein